MRKFLKRNRMILICMVFLGIYFIYNMHTSNQKLEALNALKLELESEIRTLENDIVKLNDAYEYVQTPDAVERSAREKLKMVRANEIIFLIRGFEGKSEGDD